MPGRPTHSNRDHDSLAEWSKALAQGASPQGRGREPHSYHLHARSCALRSKRMTMAGFKPAIPGSVGRCHIHWATGPSGDLADAAKSLRFVCLRNYGWKCDCCGVRADWRLKPAPSTTGPNCLKRRATACAAKRQRMHHAGFAPRASRNMTAVAFEPTQLALVELESTPLGHSGKLS